MSTTKQPKTREARLERCLRDVLNLVGDQAEYLERDVGADQECQELVFLNKVARRIRRTLRPRPITVKQMRDMLAITGL